MTVGELIQVLETFNPNARVEIYVRYLGRGELDRVAQDRVPVKEHPYAFQAAPLLIPTGEWSPQYRTDGYGEKA